MSRNETAIIGIRERLAYRYGRPEAERLCSFLEARYKPHELETMRGFLHKAIEATDKAQRRTKTKSIQPIWELLFGKNKFSD